MAVELRSFRRLVLGLEPRASGHTLRLAVEFANVLNLELLGVFFEDTSLHHLAAMPFARELRPLGGGWHPLEAGEMSRHLEAAARAAERLLAEAARQVSREWRFEIARGPLASSMAAVSRTSDIVVIGEPMSAAERAGPQFSWLIDAALKSTAAVLIVPSRVARFQGPVVAVAASADDLSLAVAADIAAATNEDLIVVDRCKAPIAQEGIEALGLARGRRIEHVVAGPGAAHEAASLSRVLHPFRERLIVLTRQHSDGGAVAAIAAERRVPVLVVEPQ